MASAAFFDVDETLVATKTMFSFLHFHLLAETGGTRRFDYFMSVIHARVKQGASREEINRRYYSFFAGFDRQLVRQRARSLFADGELPFIASTLRCLRAHQASGERIVLVSGAMEDIIHPIGARLGVDGYLCTELEVVDGKYTGRVSAVSIGQAKAKRVLAYCATHDIDLQKCSAYGDHVSDLPMLTAVGAGYMVLQDGALSRVSTESWQEEVA